VKGCLQFIGGAVVLFFGFVFLCAVVGSSSTGTKPHPAQAAVRAPKPEPELGSKVDALIMSRRFVEMRLRAPRTARFPNSFDDGVQIESLGKGRWRVLSYVDAQNGFGGEVRTRYKCVMRTDDGETWIPEVVKLYE
jgi:hypothetical protein